MADWKKIKAEYIAGGISYRELAKKHNVKFSNLKNVAIKEKWTTLREQAKNRTDTRLVENIGKQNAKIDDKYFSLVDKVLDKADMVVEQMPEWTVATVKEMAMALRYLKECKGVKSDMDLREQEARIANLRKQAEADGTGAAPIKVIISDELSEFSD